MATYTTTTGGNWTAPATWGSASYPQLNIDLAIGNPPSSTPITANLTTAVALKTLRSSGLGPFNVTGTGTINFSSTGTIEASAPTWFPYIEARVVSAANSPIAFTGSSTRAYVLKNPNNSIYQITFLGSETAVGFDSASCLGITHPTFIFSSSVVTKVVNLFSTGTGGTIAKSLGNGAAAGNSLKLYSNGTGPIKIGITNQSVPITSLILDGTMAIRSTDSDDNTLYDNFAFAASSNSVSKNGICRWIVSGSILTANNVFINDGAFQMPVGSVNASAFTSITPRNSVNSCFEISGSGTVRSTCSIVLASNVVGTNRMGALRVTSSSSITASTVTMNAGSKVAAATGATLTLPTFVNNPQNVNLFFGGEGTVNLQYALGGTFTTVAITKEDSGILRMSTNDKTYLANTNINGGTLLCDGPTRISGSTLVTVANGARLRTSFVGTTSLSVKALTLNAGSIVQVG